MHPIEANPAEAYLFDGGPYPLRGRALRLLLAAELMEGDVLTTHALAERLVDRGYPLAGRPSKVVADALRWECRAGRIERVGRGRYRFVATSPAMTNRIRRFARRCRSWLVAHTRATIGGQAPAPEPSDPPPWSDLAWLWGNERRPPDA
ncbi:MAG: hypothetical protein AAGD35_17050 [Actinomycetota bacterium]